MRLLSIIFLFVFSVALQAQTAQVDFRTGDHIYYVEHMNDPPTHYQVDRENDLRGLDLICQELTEYGPPECILYFDTEIAIKSLHKGPSGEDLIMAMYDPLNSGVVAYNHDVSTMPIYSNNKVSFCNGKFLVVRTPQLRKSTSFKISTNNRVFVFVKRYSNSVIRL